MSDDETLARIQRGPAGDEFTKKPAERRYAGIQAARGEVIVLLDGDRQNDPRDIRSSWWTDKARTRLRLSRERKDTAFKRVQSRIANFVRSRFTGDGVRDTGCTLKAMRRECREALVPFHGMHRFIPALVKGMGYKLAEVPTNHRPRTAGVSKYGFGNRAWKATCDMFAVKWLLSRQVKIRIRRGADGE